MIVTREHFLCAGALDSKALTELRDLKQTVKRHLEGIYGDIWCFEHGPSASGRSVGCGVDHAHVHAVPLMFDLLAAATPELPANVAWQEASLSGCQGAHRLGRDYLYVETPEGTTFLASGNDFQGQVFRRTIARESGCSGEYNWRDYPKPEVALRTIRVLRERADVASEVGIIDSPFS